MRMSWMETQLVAMHNAHFTFHLHITSNILLVKLNFYSTYFLFYIFSIVVVACIYFCVLSFYLPQNVFLKVLNVFLAFMWISAATLKFSLRYKKKGTKITSNMEGIINYTYLFKNIFLFMDQIFLRWALWDKKWPRQISTSRLWPWQHDWFTFLHSQKK